MSNRVGLIDKKPETGREISFSRHPEKDHSQTCCSAVNPTLYRQRNLGNQVLQRMVESKAVQPKLKIGQPNDRYEQEADRTADQIMRMPEPDIKRKAGCTECMEEENEEVIRPKQSASRAPPLDPVLQNRIQPISFSQPDPHLTEVAPGVESHIRNLKKGGQPLPKSTRSFFEPRFGIDFSQVRVHTDTEAAQLAYAMNARAYTLGRDIVFGEGQYSPVTENGRHLLAHELTHCLQQRSTGEHIQREVLIAGPEDTSDPLFSMDPDDRNEMILDLVEELSEGFTVTSTSAVGATGEIVPIVPGPTDCTDADTVVNSGSKPVGDCCLCILTRSLLPWTVRVVSERGASTNLGTGRINIPTSTSPAQSGHWTQTDVRRMRPRVITFAHELCGHAALDEIGAHPGGSRVAGRGHDPTNRVERAIWAEQLLPQPEERGLADSPIHRGESFTRVVVSNFPFADTDPANLPAGEQDKLRLAARLAYFPNPSPPTGLFQ